MNSQEHVPTLLDLGHLVRGWRLLAASTVAGMVAGVLLLQVIQPRQEVGAKLLVEQRGSALDGKYSSSREKEFLPTQAEVMSSPAVISSAVCKTESRLSQAEVAIRVAEAAKELKVDPLAGTNILQVRYSDHTAQQAIDLVNALVDAYLEYLAVAEQEYQQQMLATLKSQENEYQTQLAGLHAEYERLITAGSSRIAADADASGRMLAGLEESRAAAQSRRVLLECALEQFHGRSKTLLTTARAEDSAIRDSVFGSTNNSPGYEEDLQRLVQDLSALSLEPWSGVQNPAELAGKLLDARSHASELTISLGPQHPGLQAARAAVERYEQELRRVVQTAPATIQLALNGVRLEEASLQQRYDAHLRLAREAQLMRLKEVRKLDEIDRLQHSGELIQAQLQQWQSVDHATTSSQSRIHVTVLEAPMPAERSVVANPLIIMGISGLLGLLLGVSGISLLPQFLRMMPAQSQNTPAPSSYFRVQEARS